MGVGICWNCSRPTVSVPIGKGLKLILRGTKPESARCKANWFDAGTIEVYDRKRLFAITGQLFDGCPAKC